VASKPKTNPWWRRLSLALPFVPVAFALEHVVPAGIPTAEGCSGSYSGGEGWQYLRVPAEATVEGDDGIQRIPVATDGFVVLEGQFDDEELDLDVSGVQVSVTTHGGADVPGSLTFLRATSQNANYHGKLAYLGWSATAGLEVGTQLTLAMTAAPAPREAGLVLQESFELQVVGPPTPLTDVALTFGAWLEFDHGIGDSVSCLADYGSCGTDIITVRPELELLEGVETFWSPPKPSGMVAWEAHAELADSALEPLSPEAPTFVLSEGDVRPATGRVVFPRDSEEHCAVLVVRDLRTGVEVRSSRACAEPGAPEYSIGDNPFQLCAEPPSEELKERWCEGASHADHEVCRAGAAGAAGAGGARADGGAGGAGDAQDDEAVPAKAAGSSGGCQYASGAFGNIAATLALLTLIAAGLTRRRRASIPRAS
jgi:hypothetical protein